MGKGEFGKEDEEIDGEEMQKRVRVESERQRERREGREGREREENERKKPPVVVMYVQQFHALYSPATLCPVQIMKIYLFA